MHDLAQRNGSIAKLAAVGIAARRLSGVAKLDQGQSRRKLRQSFHEQRLMPPVISVKRDAERRRSIAGHKIERLIETVEKGEFTAAITVHRLQGQDNTALLGQRQQLVDRLAKQ